MVAILLLSFLGMVGFAVFAASQQAPVYRRWRADVSRYGAVWKQCPIDHGRWLELRTVIPVFPWVLAAMLCVEPGWWIAIHWALLVACVYPLVFNPLFNTWAKLPTMRMLGETAATDVLLCNVLWWMSDGVRNTTVFLAYAAGTTFDLYLIVHLIQTT